MMVFISLYWKKINLYRNFWTSNLKLFVWQYLRIKVRKISEHLLELIWIIHQGTFKIPKF